MADVLVTLNQTSQGQVMQNVICFSNMTETNADLQALADQLRANYAANVLSLQSTSWSLDSIDVGFIDGDTISYTVNVPFTLGPLVGTGSGERQANQLALMVRLVSVGPKPNRGRIYFGGLTEGSLEDGLWLASHGQSFENIVDFWIAGFALDSTTVFLRICRRPSNVFPSYVTNGIDFAQAELVPTTQRRRRIGQGV